MEHVARMTNEMHTEFWSEDMKGEDHSEDAGVGSGVIMKQILKKLGVDVSLIHLAQDRDQ
jgi:hypothetical protein